MGRAQHAVTSALTGLKLFIAACLLAFAQVNTAAALDRTVQLSATAGSSTRVSDVAVDSLGNVYVLGNTSGRGTISYKTVSATLVMDDGWFLLKVDPSGTPLWLRTPAAGAGVTANGRITMRRMAVGADNTVHVIGDFARTAFANLSLPAPLVQDTFVWKLSAEGATIWHKVINIQPELGMMGQSIVVSASGQVSVGAIIIRSAINDTTGSPNGYSEAFILKMMPDGTPIWSRTFNSTQSSTVLAIRLALDPNERLVTATTFSTSDFLVLVPLITLPGTQSALVMRHADSTGDPVWTRIIGGRSMFVTASDIHIDSSANIYVTGSYFGQFGGALSSPPLSIVGNNDGFLIKYTSDGDVTWVRRMAAASASILPGRITKDRSNNLHITGTMNGNSAPLLGLNRIGGLQDGWLLSYSPEGTPLFSTVFGGPSSTALGTSVAAVKDGSILVGGQFSGGPMTAPPLTSVGSGSGFVISHSPGITLQPTPPEPPRIDRVEVGDGSVTISFSPRSDGGSPITAFVATCGDRSQTVFASPVTVFALRNGERVSCRMIARNLIGDSVTSIELTDITPLAVQRIAFSPPPDRVLSATPVTLVATGGGSGNPVIFRTVDINICVVGGENGSVVTLRETGTCIIIASQAGSGSFQTATPVQRTFQVIAPTAAQSLSANASPLQIRQGDSVTLYALVSGPTPTGAASFIEGGQPIAGCANVATQFLPGTEVKSMATCTFSATTAGVRNVSVRFAPADSRPQLQTNVSVAVAATGPRNFADMWWAGSAENGWGMAVTQKGDVQFNALYVYDANGRPTWYVMPGGSWDSAFTTYTGALYRPTSAPFDAYDQSRFVANASVGTMAITFADTNRAELRYTINGISGQKTLTRQSFGRADNSPALVVRDLWWGGATQNGWGVTVAQQERQLFAVWFTYAADGSPTWYVLPDGAWVGSAFFGTLFSTTSSPWLGVQYDPTRLNVNTVGTLTLDFANAQSGNLTYTVGTTTQTKAIVRQPF
jgi:hypothetical protein